MRDDDVSKSGLVAADDRRALLGLLACQLGVGALCLDETIALCEWPRQVAELGFRVFEPDDEVSIPLEVLRESDRELVLGAVLRARSDGIADVIARRDADDVEIVVHVVNMLDEWGVLVVVIGGMLRPSESHELSASDPLLPRRLVHRRDRTGHMLSVDEATERLLGWTPKQMLGVSAARFVDPADHERAIRVWMDMLAGNHTGRSRVRYLTSRGERRWLEVTLTNRLDDPGSGDVEVELIDVHDEMLALSAASFGEAQFDALTESLPVGVIQVNVDGETVYSNRWMRELTGATTEQLVPGDAMNGNDVTLVKQAFDAAIANGESADIDVRLIGGADRGQRQCRFRIRSLGRDENGSSRGAIASIEDMTDSLELHARLYRQIRTDGLTDLPNRIAANEWLADHLLDGPGMVGVTVLYLDLDGFKHVNDVHGHDAGDRLLNAIARRLSDAIQPSDLLARIGGDEFVIARAALLDDRACAQLAQRVLDVFNDRIDIDNAEVAVGCSIGIARHEGPNNSSIVLADADLAMYHAKHDGGRRWVIYHHRLRPSADALSTPVDTSPTPTQVGATWLTPAVTRPIAHAPPFRH